MFVANARSMNDDDFDDNNKLNIISISIRLLVVVFSISSSGCCEVFWGEKKEKKKLVDVVWWWFFSFFFSRLTIYSTQLLRYFATTQFQQKIRSYFSTRLRTPKQVNSLSLSLVKKAHTQTKPHTKEERARASLAGHTTTTRGSLANARGKESVVAANSTQTSKIKRKREV